MRDREESGTQIPDDSFRDPKSGRRVHRFNGKQSPESPNGRFG